jgi:hypothetical protein
VRLPFTAAARVAIALLAALAASARPSRADSREVYALASLVPGVASVREPGAAGAPRFSAALELTALYGLTNELHLGGALRLGGLKNAALSPASAMLPDGSLLAGTLYEDSLQLGVSLSVAYRFDLGPRWAPVLRLDAGLSYRSYPARSLVSDASGPSPPLSAPLPAEQSLNPALRIALLLQRRLGDELAVEAGVALRTEPGPRGALLLEFPLTVCWIF